MRFPPPAMRILAFLLTATFISCGRQAAVRPPTDCLRADARLGDLWHALEDVRSSGDGCRTAAGADRCEDLRHEIERLTYVCPNHSPALMANAILAYDARNPVKAQQLLDSLLAIPTLHPDAAVLRGRIALEEGNVPFALHFLEEQMRLSADHAGLRETYAAALYVAGRFEEARTYLMQAANLGAPPWRVAYHRGLLEEAAGAPLAALVQYDQALKLKPDWSLPAARAKGLRARYPEAGRAQTPP